jgi:beta-N-acetylhexosaminidase
VSLPIKRHDEKTLQYYDLPPFEAAIDAGVPMVMVGYLIYPAIDPHNPASLSRDAISMLRRDLGFKGVVVTDDLTMAGAKGGGTTAEAAVEAIEAGADLLVVSSLPQQQADAYDAVVARSSQGRCRVRASGIQSSACSGSRRSTTRTGRAGIR